MRIPLCFMIATIMIMVVCFVFVVKANDSIVEIEEAEGTELIERISRGIIKWRTIWDRKKIKKKDRTIENGNLFWFVCGKRIKKSESKKRSLKLATRIVDIVRQIENENGVSLNIWGYVATIANESGFDNCAVDRRTRNNLHDLGLLKRNRVQITYKREDLINALTSKKWKDWIRAYNRKSNAYRLKRDRYRIDLGIGQIRTDGEKLNRTKLAEIFTVEHGLKSSVEEMIRRGTSYPYNKDNPFSRPWALWPGKDPTHKFAKKYDRRITKVARFLGATEEEI